MLYWVAHSPGFLSKQDLVAVREKSVVECTVNPALYASQCMTGLSPVMALKATPSHLKEVVNDRITSLHCLDPSGRTFQFGKVSNKNGQYIFRSLRSQIQSPVAASDSYVKSS